LSRSCESSKLLIHSGITPPVNGEPLILHPAFQLWKEEFEWYKAKYPEIKTFNCTGRGALFRKDFVWKPISEMKSWNENS